MRLMRCTDADWAEMLVWQFLTRNKFYVIIDDHTEDGTFTSDPTVWVNLYRQVSR